MVQKTTDRGRAALSDTEVERLREWIADDGEIAVLAEAGVSRLSLYRCTGALSVLAGTRAMMRAALARRGA